VTQEEEAWRVLSVSRNLAEESWKRRNSKRVDEHRIQQRKEKKKKSVKEGTSERDRQSFITVASRDFLEAWEGKGAASKGEGQRGHREGARDGKGLGPVLPVKRHSEDANQRKKGKGKRVSPPMNSLDRGLEVKELGGEKGF